MEYVCVSMSLLLYKQNESGQIMMPKTGTIPCTLQQHPVASLPFPTYLQTDGQVEAKSVFWLTLKSAKSHWFNSLKPLTSQYLAHLLSHPRKADLLHDIQSDS